MFIWRNSPFKFAHRCQLKRTKLVIFCLEVLLGTTRLSFPKLHKMVMIIQADWIITYDTYPPLTPASSVLCYDGEKNK